MRLIIRPILVLISISIIAGCNPEKQTTISGQIDYVGSANIFLSKQPIHYKYAPKKRFPISVDDNGGFSVRVPIDSAQIVKLHIDDKSYPIAAKPNNNLELDIAFSDFPNSVSVNGYPEPWDQLFSEYRNEIAPIEQQISQALPAFRNGENTNIPELYKSRYQKAQQYFADTPLQYLYYKTIGEYLVKHLEKITYQRTQSNFNPQEKRQQILEKAKNLNFFSFESLHAQRAGIRDFTNALANTFGVADSLEEQYGQELTKYDVKRLGYSKLDSARTSVLEYIDEPKAKAYAKMHLIAERIGEMPLDVATPSYEQFLQEYADFPKYTSFLKTFYKQIKRVSPGQPAVAFTLPNEDEKMVQMKDFRGKYVLLISGPAGVFPAWMNFDTG